MRRADMRRIVFVWNADSGNKNSPFDITCNGQNVERHQWIERKLRGRAERLRRWSTVEMPEQKSHLP